MDETTLAKNIWELEHRIKEGHGDPRTRLSLLRAYSQQVALTESELGIPPEDRAYLKVSDRGRDGVLLIHGSAGSPAQLRSLADHLRTGGFSVYGIRLPGHPADDAQLATHSWRAGLEEAESRYRVLSTYCRRLYVVGFSLGATLALCMNVRPRPHALVLLAPALQLKLNPISRWVLSVGVHNWAWVRRRLGWKAEVLDSMDEAQKQNWWYGLPAMGAMCKDDYRVSKSSMDFLKKHGTHASSRYEMYPKGGHVFMDDAPRAELQNTVLEFLKEN